MVVALANTPTYGGGIVIAPHARLDNGKLEVCVVGAMAKARLLRLFPSVYSGRHLDLPGTVLAKRLAGREHSFGDLAPFAAGRGHQDHPVPGGS